MHWRQQVIVGDCVVGRMFPLSLGYWYTFCIALDASRRIHVLILIWCHSHVLISMSRSQCVFLPVL